MNRKVQKIVACMMSLVVLVLLRPQRAYALDYEVPVNRQVEVDGVNVGQVMTLNYYYDHNIYISLKGLQYALYQSPKAFTLSLYDGEIHITKGQGEYVAPLLFTEEELNSPLRIDVGRHKIFVGEEEKKYYTVKKGLSDGSVDYFLSLIDAAMIFDLAIDVENEVIKIDTTRGFTVTPEDIIASGYLQGVNGLCVGDVSTGDIYLAYEEEYSVPIASTSKLMTYYLVMEAVREGEIALTDMVTITKEAETMSKSVDGVIVMQEGMQVSVSELITGALLPSSNECAYSLATYVAGSEEAFVERMNAKCAEFGLSSAIFYNSHGLPLYTEQCIPGKVQNHMSAKDMFTFVGHLLQDFPQVLDITSIRETWLPALGTQVRNTNILIYNIPEVKGLKTGTTNKAGACLVTAIPVEYEGNVHNLVVVLLGAETNIDRETISELCARCALQVLRAGGSTGEIREPEEEGIPDNPELVMQKLLRVALQEEQSIE